MVTISAPRKKTVLGRGKHTDRAGYTLAEYEKIEHWCRKAEKVARVDVSDSDSSWYRAAIERIFEIVEEFPRTQAQVDELAELEDTMRYAFGLIDYDPDPNHLVPNFALLASIQYRRQCNREGIR